MLACCLVAKQRVVKFDERIIAQLLYVESWTLAFDVDGFLDFPFNFYRLHFEDFDHPPVDLVIQWPVITGAPRLQILFVSDVHPVSYLAF